MAFTVFLSSMMLVLVHSATIEPSVHRALQQADKINVFVSFPQGIAGPLKRFAQLKTAFTSRFQQTQSFVDGLLRHSETSQSEFMSTLKNIRANASLDDEDAFHAESFWITNEVFIKGANAKLIRILDRVPGITVREELVWKKTPTEAHETEQPALVNADADPTALAATLEATQRRLRAAQENNGTRTFSNLVQGLLNRGKLPWGIRDTQANDAWNRYKIRGQNIVVASIDTGVHGAHVELVENQRRDLSWFDPYESTSKPIDTDGHGTHTLATIVGKSVGMAPDAEWIACRGCGPENCSQRALLLCAQWVLCPTDPQGQNKDCTKSPDVVNNSWGSSDVGRGAHRRQWEDIVSAWKAAGIIPIFAGGNEGPTCGSVSFPGDFRGVTNWEVHTRQNLA